MAAGSFLAGGLSGYTSQAGKMKKGGEAGLLRKKKKPKVPPVAPAQTIKLPQGAMPTTYKKGGKVRKTGMAKVHRGERVLTRKQTKRYKKR